MSKSTDFYKLRDVQKHASEHDKHFIAATRWYFRKQANGNGRFAPVYNAFTDAGVFVKWYKHKLRFTKAANGLCETTFADQAGRLCIDIDIKTY